MARTCTICNHKDRKEIDKALLKGTSFRTIAGQYRVSKSALQRHKENCIPVHLVKARDAQEVAQAGDLLAEVRELQARTLDILSAAENAGDLRAALYGVQQARGNSELLCKMIAHLEERERQAGFHEQRENHEEIQRLARDPVFTNALHQALNAAEEAGLIET